MKYFDLSQQNFKFWRFKKFQFDEQKFEKSENFENQTFSRKINHNIEIFKKNHPKSFKFDQKMLILGCVLVTMAQFLKSANLHNYQVQHSTGQARSGS